MDVGGGAGEDEKNCDWVRVESEALVFFIEERGGGGGKLWHVRCWDEVEVVSWRLSDDTQEGWLVVGRLRRGGEEGRGCGRGFGTGLR